MNKTLYFTDDQGRDHKLSKFPKLIGLNTTEWWWLNEIMKTQKCKCKSKSVTYEYQSSETTVTTPSGDRYEIGKWAEIVTYVKKL